MVTPSSWIVLLLLVPACAGEAFVSHALDQAPIELAGPSVVPLEDGSRPVVGVVLDGRPPRRFLVDTGAGISWISARCVAELGLTELPYAASFETVGAGGAGRRIDSYVRPKVMELGDLRVRDARIAVIDDPALDIVGDGIIGQDLLARLMVTLDMQRRQLHLVPDSGPEAVRRYLETSELGAGAWIHFEADFRPSPMIQVVFPEEVFELMLDTGAEATSLPRRWLESLQREPHAEHEMGAIGGSYTARSYIEAFNLFGLTFLGEFTVAPQEYGLLGMDVLSHWLLLIDGPAETVWLHVRK